MMQNCTKTIGKESGNATYQAQNNGWTLLHLHSHFLLGKLLLGPTLKRISDVHGNHTR